MSSFNELEIARNEAEEGQWILADARVSNILKTNPGDTGALRLKAHIVLVRGLPRLTAAILEQVAILEATPQAWLDAAVAHRRVANMSAAEGAVRAYLQLLPDDPEGLRSLAELLHHSGRPGEALRILESIPDGDSGPDPVHLHLLSRVLGDLGRHQDSIRNLRLVHAQNPASCWSELLARLAEDMEISGQAYREAVKKIMPLNLQQWIHPRSVFPKSQQPEKRLKIGYISSDFFGHAVSRFILDLFQAHNRNEIELCLFSEVHSPDALTNVFKNRADQWVSILGRSDVEVSDQIRAMGIDILVELNGFTGGHRLGVFALRSAPIQVVYSIGFGPSRGMPNLDVKFTDLMTEAPSQAQAWNAETLVSLEGPRLHFAWPTEAPEVGPLPSSQGVPFTFGCLNSTHKIEGRTLEIFATILKAEPKARLLLMWPSLEDASGIKDRLDCFQSLGVHPSQVEYVPRSTRENYLGYHHRVDIALNPLNAFGMSTILEAAWMGVPTLHLDSPCGMRHPGRYLAQEMGLEEWVVDSLPAYVEQARAWMKRPEELAALRQSLRPRAVASSFSDSQAVARALERAYRTLWRDWCEGRFPYHEAPET